MQKQERKERKTMAHKQEKQQSTETVPFSRPKVELIRQRF